MGLVADLTNCRFSLDPINESVYIGMFDEEILLQMQSFQVQFGFKFDKLAGTAPRKTELWQVGVLQNVLYEKFSFRYQNNVRVSKEFTTPALDTSSTFDPPFATDAVRKTRREVLGSNVPKPNALVDLVVPMREVYYNVNGFGELLDPWEDPPNDVILMSGAQVNAIDAPRFGCKLRTSEGNRLLVAEQLTAFGIWLVALDYDRKKTPLILAKLDTFTIAYQIELSWPASGTLVVPGTSRKYYGTRGIARIFQAGLGTDTTPILKFQRGGSRPVLAGETANDRDRKWLEQKVLSL